MLWVKTYLPILLPQGRSLHTNHENRLTSPLPISHRDMHLHSTNINVAISASKLFPIPLPRIIIYGFELFFFVPHREGLHRYLEGGLIRNKELREHFDMYIFMGEIFSPKNATHK